MYHLADCLVSGKNPRDVTDIIAVNKWLLPELLEQAVSSKTTQRRIDRPINSGFTTINKHAQLLAAAQMGRKLDSLPSSKHPTVVFQGKLLLLQRLKPNALLLLNCMERAMRACNPVVHNSTGLGVDLTDTTFCSSIFFCDAPDTVQARILQPNNRTEETCLEGIFIFVKAGS
jgi:hypothetical protein